MYYLTESQSTAAHIQFCTCQRELTKTSCLLLPNAVLAVLGLIPITPKYEFNGCCSRYLADRMAPWRPICCPNRSCRQRLLPYPSLLLSQTVSAEHQLCHKKMTSAHLVPFFYLKESRPATGGVDQSDTAGHFGPYPWT